LLTAPFSLSNKHTLRNTARTRSDSYLVSCSYFSGYPTRFGYNERAYQYDKSYARRHKEPERVIDDTPLAIAYTYSPCVERAAHPRRPGALALATSEKRNPVSALGLCVRRFAISAYRNRGWLAIQSDPSSLQTVMMLSRPSKGCTPIYGTERGRWRVVICRKATPIEKKIPRVHHRQIVYCMGYSCHSQSMRRWFVDVNNV
jgi:hypothetical protein